MNFTRYRKLLILASLSLLCLLFTGCTAITIKKCSAEEWQKKNTELSFNYDGLSNLSRNSLISHNLLKDIDDKPEEAIDRLYQLFKLSGESNYLRVLTELCFHQGNESSDNDRKVAFHAAACYFSYQYLFEQQRRIPLSPYSPDFFIMGRYYNSALNTVFTYLKEQKLLLNSGFNLPSIGGITLTFEHPLDQLPALNGKQREMFLCSNFLVNGMQTYTYAYGLGVPLIVADLDLDVTKPLDQLQEIVYPSTMFMRLSDQADGKTIARLEFFDTLVQNSINVDNETVALELDCTTPIAYLLRKPPLFAGIKYMFSPGEAEKYTGLFWLTPPSKDKIPVVLVHGLMSNPRTWAQMVNTLLGDPRIRQHYQFWFFAYPTGNPVLFSASKLRESLNAIEPLFKDGGEESFNRMVIVAHSMGCLLAKTMIQDSGNQLIDNFTGENQVEFDKELTPELIKFLNDILVFERLPFVQRVIFMAAPHRGSDIALWTAVRWVSARIALPAFMLDKAKQISDRLLARAHLRKDLPPLRIFTGIDNMAPDNRALKALNSLKLSDQVPYHTICGNKEQVGVLGGTDGVVPYSSSHLDDAKSELIVKSGHSVHENAMAIEEVRRLLLLHLQENGLLED